MDEKFLRYFLGELDPQEIHELIAKLEVDENLKKKFLHQQNLFATSQLITLKQDKQEGTASYWHFIQKISKTKHRILIKKTLQYAAVSAILIASTFFTTLYFSNRSGSLNLTTLHVPTGQRAQLTLEDGTTIWVNAQSTLRYPSKFSKKTRKVEIIGEAYFDVAKDKHRPFIVTTNQMEMKVIGTEFNIHSYPESGYIQTDLIKGALKVYKTNNEQNGIILKPNERLTLKNDKMYVNTISNNDNLLWVEGIYAFENEKLIDILEKLQLYYDVKIIVQNSGIADMKYTGKFRQRDGIEEILRIIQKVKPFEIKKNTEKNELTLY